MGKVIAFSFSVVEEQDSGKRHWVDWKYSSDEAGWRNGEYLVAES